MPEEMNDAQADHDIEIDDGLDDLLDDAGLPAQVDDDPPKDEGKSDDQDEGERTEAPEDKPDSDKADEGQPDADDVVGDKPQDETKEDSDDDTVKFKYRGKEYSLDDLRADPDLANKVFTGANQQANYQKLHEATKAEMEEMKRELQELRQAEEKKRQAAEAERQAANAPKLTPDKLSAEYREVADKMAEEGWIEGDLNDLYPNAVAGVMSMRDEMFTRLAYLEATIGSLINHTQGDIQQRQKIAEKQTHEQQWNQLQSIFDGLAQEGGIFAPLSSEDTRTEFLTEIEQTLNPEIDHLLSDPNVLRTLWVGKNHEALTRAAEAAQAKRNTRQQEALRNAAGEGGGAAAVSSNQTKSPMAGETEGWADL